MKPGWVRVLPNPLRARLEGRLNFQRILANAGWLLADRVLRLGIGLLVGAWVARYLGPGQLGLYNYALAFVGLFGILATLGLDSIVVRELVRDPTRPERILGTTFALKFVGGWLTLAVSVAAIAVWRPLDEPVRMIVAIVGLGVVFQSLDAIDFWFQARVQSKYTVLARDVAFLVLAAVKLLLIQGRAPLEAFVWAGTVEIALGAAGLAVVYRLTGQSLLRWRVSGQQARDLLRSSWPLALSGLAVWVYMRIDQLMLGSMIGDEAVGVYSVAVRLSEMWYFIPTIIVNSVFPAVVEAKQVDERLYRERTQRLFNLMTLIAYAVAIPVSLLSGWIVNLLYGPQFADAAPMLTILVWAGLFVALGVAREAWVVTEGIVHFSFATTLIGALVNIILNLIWIPLYGGLAASVATLAAQFVAVSLATLIYPRTRPIFRMQLQSLYLKGGLWP